MNAPLARARRARYDDGERSPYPRLSLVQAFTSSEFSSGRKRGFRAVRRLVEKLRLGMRINVKRRVHRPRLPGSGLITGDEETEEESRLRVENRYVVV